MVGLIIITAAAIAATVIGITCMDKRQHRKWQKGLRQEDLFLKIKAYREEIGG